MINENIIQQNPSYFLHFVAYIYFSEKQCDIWKNKISFFLFKHCNQSMFTVKMNFTGKVTLLTMWHVFGLVGNRNEKNSIFNGSSEVIVVLWQPCVTSNPFLWTFITQFFIFQCRVYFRRSLLSFLLCKKYDAETSLKQFFLLIWHH